MLDRFFLTEAIPLELCLDYHHEAWLVGLSYLVAAFASYTAFHLIDRVRSAQNSRIRTIWLAIAGMSMGCGIFAMHFIAMLAVRITVPVEYEVSLTALSVLFAIGASGIAFHLAGSKPRNMARLSAGALILGSGIGLMHYTGMFALRMPARIYYDPYLFALSVVVAVALSALALSVLRSGAIWHRLKSRARHVGALVMGLAVTLMHYTGMLATYFFPEPDAIATGAVFGGTGMAIAVGGATFLISSVAVIAALLDRRAELAEAQRAESESFLQTVIDNSVEGILTFGEDMVIRTCNPAAGRIFRCAVSSILGRRLDRFIDDDVMSAMDRERAVPRREGFGLRGDGERCAIEYSVNDLHFAGERVFTCIVRDITNRKAAEEALRLSEERFRNLVVNVPGVVFQRRLDGEGRYSYTYVSERLRELVGLDPAAVVEDGAVLFDIVYPEDREAYWTAARRSAAELSTWDQVFRILTASGERKWVRSISQPRRTAGGETLWDGLFLDVTASVRQAEATMALETKLRQVQKMDSLGTLAGGIAHEFNNMLVPIGVLAELTMSEVPENGRAYNNLQTIARNAGRAGQLVEKILSFSRQEDGERSALPIGDVVAETVELLQATCPATITIRAELDRSVGSVLADETQIQQVLMNLASNARHAMDGKLGEITIRLKRVVFESDFAGRKAGGKAGAYAKLTVSDTGHGMDEATIERIFDPFFTTKEVGKGTGLGLAVIHGIVTGHGGAIDVASAPGAGTDFDIYLPLHEGAAPALAANV